MLDVRGAGGAGGEAIDPMLYFWDERARNYNRVHDRCHGQMMVPPDQVQRIRQRPTATGSARRARAFRRLRERRSSSDNPPQTPSSLPDSMAQLRQSSMTSHRRQTA